MQWLIGLLVLILVLAGLFFYRFAEPRTPFGKETFFASRPCAEMRFSCLPESQDPAWRAKFEGFELKERRQFHPSDRKVMTEVRLRAFMDEIIADIERQFPDFWQGVDEQTRTAWVDAVFDKCDEWGFNKSRGDAMQFADLIARLGLDFDQRPENQPLVEFLKTVGLSNGTKLSESCDYIDWVLSERDFDDFGYQISIWGMRNILDVMPWPERQPPELPSNRAAEENARRLGTTVGRNYSPRPPSDKTP